MVVSRTASTPRTAAWFPDHEARAMSRHLLLYDREIGPLLALPVAERPVIPIPAAPCRRP